ncbi:MAG: sigma 54-interacting transcriptional regulator [Deltaproteobacteria bacterium]|jgi:arginine utilization regulatory protein|nr:sigma 54-interacting transcriptional regulator [Deltaproteobacteria bacterium]
MKQIQIKHLFPHVNPNSISFIQIMDHFTEGVLITDNKGVVLYFNEAQAKIDDLSADYMIGKNVKGIYRVDNDNTPIMKCLKAKKSITNFACYYRTHRGKLVNSIHNVFPIYSEKRIIGTICFVIDYSMLEQTFDAISKPRRKKINPALNSLTDPIKRQLKENGTRFTFNEIVGKSSEFLKVVESVRQASDSPSSIMLYGETGTGKELLAQSIHNNSRRTVNQYVAINCSAIPEHLLEGILFGTSKGAFTGAIDKPGLFERANGGTLFLDEINSMPTGLQAKLLRVVQERKVRRVGSLAEIEIDLKLISSVNEDPYQSVKTGKLRQDLFYRLCVLFVQIPSLRERMDDMELLIKYFLNKFNISLNKTINSISAEVLELFHKYHWPGNVRELEHVIEGTMNLVKTGEILEVRHLPKHVQNFDNQLNHWSSKTQPLTSSETVPGQQLNVVFPSVAQPISSNSPGKSLDEIQTETEIAFIRQTLATFQGSISKTARYLGLSPQLLHYRMKKFKIDRQEFVV